MERLGGRWVRLDLLDLEGGDERVVREVVGFGGGVDVLVNCAGYSVLGSVEDISNNEAHRQLETNFFGPLRLIRAFLPGMREEKGGYDR